MYIVHDYPLIDFIGWRNKDYYISFRKLLNIIIISLLHTLGIEVQLSVDHMSYQCWNTTFGETCYIVVLYYTTQNVVLNKL